MGKGVLYFLAGVFGALVTDVFILIFGTLPVKSILGVEFAPEIDLIALVVDLLSGGLFGLLFFLPFLNSNPIVKGAFLSVIPFLFHLFIKNRLLGEFSPFTPDTNLTLIGLMFAFDLFWGLTSGSFLAFVEDSKNLPIK